MWDSIARAMVSKYEVGKGSRKSSDAKVTASAACGDCRGAVNGAAFRSSGEFWFESQRVQEYSTRSLSPRLRSFDGLMQGRAMSPSRVGGQLFEDQPQVDVIRTCAAFDQVRE